MKLSTVKHRAFCTAALLLLTLANSCWSQPGDFNFDGVWNCDDIDGLAAEIFAGTNDAQYDLTDDGLVDSDDGTRWLALAGAQNLQSGQPYLPGDGNLDGFVDASDFMIWNGSKFYNTTAWCNGNFNFDAGVDVSDFNIWNNDKFTASGPLINNDSGPLPLDDAVDFIYDASTGVMSIDTNAFEIWCFSVFGVGPEEFLLNGGSADVSADDSIWIQDFFLGHSKWFSLDVTAVEDGAIALYEPGLTADDFDYVSFGTPNGLVGRGAVTIVNGSEGTVAVPEPAGALWLLPLLAGLVAHKRKSSRKGVER